MKIQKFEEVIAWQKAQDLAVVIYSCFGNINDWGFRNQICNASVSVSNNIAEGFDRGSKADFKRFLHIALASCSEVKSMTYLAERLRFISEEQMTQLLSIIVEVAKTITGLIKYLNKLLNSGTIAAGKV